MRAVASVEAPAGRLPGLDLLRFLAAMLVLLFHYGFRGAVQGKYLAFGYPEIAGVVRFGFLALDALFILSGFVILMTVEAGGGRASRFAASRLARLYPAFLAGAGITFAIVARLPPPFGLSLHDALWNLTLAPAWFGAQPIDGAYWTLGVELNFYLLVGLCLLLPRLLCVDRVLLVWALSMVLLRWFPAQPPWVYFLVSPQWGPFFLAGCLLYRAYRDGWTRERGLHYLLAALLMVLSVRQQLLDLGGAFAQEIPAVPSWILLALLLAGLAIACTRTAWLQRGGGLAVTLGAITYPLYLLHQKLGYLLMTALRPGVGRWGALGLTVLAMLGLAWLLHRAVERPVHARLRRWLEPHLRFLDRGRGGPGERPADRVPKPAGAPEMP